MLCRTYNEVLLEKIAELEAALRAAKKEAGTETIIHPVLRAIQAQNRFCEFREPCIKW